MRRIELTGQFRRDYKREAKGRHRATLDADLEPVFEALANDQPLAHQTRLGADLSKARHRDIATRSAWLA
jgi:mRNA-degrading endonuclease YafQ of YafQ-DinJ toxin-antitoxin module